MKKELLIRLRDCVQSHAGLSGLCSAIQYRINATDQERTILLKYVTDHRPKRGKHFDRYMKYSSFYWPMYDRRPRIEWLNDQIKRFKE